MAESECLSPEKRIKDITTFLRVKKCQWTVRKLKRFYPDYKSCTMIIRFFRPKRSDSTIIRFGMLQWLQSTFTGSNGDSCSSKCRNASWQMLEHASAWTKFEQVVRFCWNFQQNRFTLLGTVSCQTLKTCVGTTRISKWIRAGTYDPELTITVYYYTYASTSLCEHRKITRSSTNWFWTSIWLVKSTALRPLPVRFSDHPTTFPNLEDSLSKRDLPSKPEEPVTRIFPISDIAQASTKIFWFLPQLWIGQKYCFSKACYFNQNHPDF